MNDNILALKYRPKFFSEVVGQDQVIQTIQNSVKLGKLHNAYLFSGTRGMGKTTIARLFAKILLCDDVLNEEPCGKCSSCNEISGTNHIDLIEIDAASRTKVEDTRNLMENVQYAPARSKYKIYLIDEVHMLSTKSFNALLKTIEEPPSHVKFLLATTESEKLPDTILSRCLHFRLNSATNTTLIENLQNILDKENISYEVDALTIIAKNSFGSIRDSLSILERCITYCKDEISTEKVSELLGDINTSLIEKITESLKRKDETSIIQLIEGVNDSTDCMLIIDELIKTFYKLMIDNITNKGSSENDFTDEDIQLVYQILLASKRDYIYAPDKRDYLIMVLLRLIIFSDRVNKKSNGNLSNDNIKDVEEKNKDFKSAHQDQKINKSSEKKSLEMLWYDNVKNMKFNGLLEHLANHSVFYSMPDNNKNMLKISSHKKDVYPDNCVNDLVKQLKEYFQIDDKIEVIYEENILTPMAIDRANNESDVNDRYDKIKDDPDVNKLKKLFNADIEKSSIKKIIE